MAKIIGYMAAEETGDALIRSNDELEACFHLEEGNVFIKIRRDEENGRDVLEIMTEPSDCEPAAKWTGSFDDVHEMLKAETEKKSAPTIEFRPGYHEWILYVDGVATYACEIDPEETPTRDECDAIGAWHASIVCDDEPLNEDETEEEAAERSARLFPYMDKIAEAISASAWSAYGA